MINGNSFFFYGNIFPTNSKKNHKNIKMKKTIILALIGATCAQNIQRSAMGVHQIGAPQRQAQGAAGCVTPPPPPSQPPCACLPPIP